MQRHAGIDATMETTDAWRNNGDLFYGDLDVSYEGQRLRKAEARCKTLERKCEALNFENQRLCDLLDKANEDKSILEKNISILYKTAKENIERLQSQNEELQRQLDQRA